MAPPTRGRRRLQKWNALDFSKEAIVRISTPSRRGGPGTIVISNPKNSNPDTPSTTARRFTLTTTRSKKVVALNPDSNAYYVYEEAGEVKERKLEKEIIH